MGGRLKLLSLVCLLWYECVSQMSIGNVLVFCGDEVRLSTKARIFGGLAVVTLNGYLGRQVELWIGVLICGTQLGKSSDSMA